MNKERRKTIESICNRLNELKNELENVQIDEQDAFDNMPESFQESERGEAMQEAIDTLETALSDIDEAIENLENI